MEQAETGLAGLLAYCRLDDPEPEQLAVLELCRRAAGAYLNQAGVRPPPEGSARRAQYDLCLWALTLDSYDQRGGQQDQPLKPNPALRQLINQLKLTEGDGPCL